MRHAAGAILGDVDLVTAKHRVDSPPHPGFFGELNEQLDGLIRDAVFRVVEKDSLGLQCHPLATLRGRSE
jgi:hypothetical protein